MSINPRPPDGPEAAAKGLDVIAGELFTKLVAGLNGIGTAWIFVMMILINLDVFMRYLFNSPVRGVPLVITMSIIGIVFLQMSDALRAGRFTRSDVMIGVLLRRRPQIGHWLQMSFYAMGAILMAILFSYSISFLETAWISQSYAGNEGDFTLPEWPVKLVILIGSSCCAVQFTRHFWQDIRFLRGFRDNEFMGTGGGDNE